MRRIRNVVFLCFFVCLFVSFFLSFFLSPTSFYLTMVRCRGVTASDHTQGHTTVGRTPLDEETNLRYDQNFLKKTAVHNTTKIALEFHFVLHFEPIPWPTGLRSGSAAGRLLELRVRIPPGAWMFVCCECCVLSGRGLCDGPITRSEESYGLWCVLVCDQMQ